MIRLSLVISTYNRADRLLVALQSLVHQSADATEWECIVVDNNSTDDTRRIFEGFASCYPTLNLRMVTETAQGLSHARNRGLAESTGHIVAIIDDDERVNDRFVEAYAGFFDRHPRGRGGRAVVWCPNIRRGVPGGCRAIRRCRWQTRPTGATASVCSRTGIFPPEAIWLSVAIRCSVTEVSTRRSAVSPGRLTGGEESDLFERMAADGIQFHYVPDAVIWHIIGAEKLTDDYFGRLSFNTGVSQRRRAVLHDRLMALYVGEAAKWCATAVLARVLSLHVAAAEGTETRRDAYRYHTRHNEKGVRQILTPFCFLIPFLKTGTFRSRPCAPTAGPLPIHPRRMWCRPLL